MMQQANGRMIVLGREARELTQSALAQRLGVGQGTLSKIEGGLLTCPPEVLTKISESLGFPEEFFTASEEIHGVGTEAHHCLYRRRAAVPAKTLKRIEAEVNIRRMNLSSLLTSTEIRPATTIPSLAIGDYNDDPAEVARALRIYWKMPSGPVDNVVRLIERAGGAILPHDFGVEGVDATSIRIPGLPPLFFYNPNLTGDRLRFTLAHELAHIVMHEVPHPNIENEADQFAAEFLMPAREIGIHLSGLTLPKAAQLKPYWKVSMAAIVYRAKTLGKITDAQYRYLFYQIGAGNMRKREPASLDIPAELPTLQTNLLAFFRKELGYSNTELAKLFRITESEFDRFYSSRSAARHLRAVA